MRVHLRGEASVQRPLWVPALARPDLDDPWRKALVALFVAGCAGAIAAPAASGARRPGWFAAQCLALILAPALVGLHYRRRRPASRFGTLLIVAGALAIPLSLQAASSPWLHRLGTTALAPLLVVTIVLVLAFPAGRLSSRPAQAIALGAVAAGALFVVALWQLTVLTTLTQMLTIAVILATGWLVAARILRADLPRRRAVAIAAAPTLAFGAGVVIWLALHLGTPAGATVGGGSQLAWGLAVSRVLIPFGYLLALLDAELYAGRVVTRIVDAALHGRDPDMVIAALPNAVGTPSLSLGFWVPGRGWTHPDGRPLATPSPDSGQVLTTIDREGRPMAAVIHSEQLDDSPELIRAVVTTSMLLYENAALEAELRSAIRELHESRARVAKAGDLERRRIESDLHDGAQQRLISLGLKLKAAGDAADGNRSLQRQLSGLCAEVDRALAEIRDLAHGIFPALLADLGLIPALHSAARNSPLDVRVAPVRSRRRYPADVEAAVYFCCLEALQNAGKHAGERARVSISLMEAGPSLRFSVRDDGAGFDPAAVSDSAGMVGMRDRLGAIGGVLRVTSSPGAGTEVRGSVPFPAPHTGRDRG